MSVFDRKQQQKSMRVSNKYPITTPAPVALALQGRPSHSQASNERRSPENGPDNASFDESSVPGQSDSKEKEKRGTVGALDKDARIAILESELAKMEDEFSQELERLGANLSEQTEQVRYWREKHSSQYQQFLKADADLQVLRTEITNENARLEKSREERERDVNTRISSLRLDRDTLQEAMHLARIELRHKEDEISRLRSQVKGLKDFVSTNSRTDGQVTDEVFGEMMQKLGNGLQNWVIQNFRRAKLELSGTTLEVRERLLALVPTYPTQISSSKIHLIQSVVSRIFLHTIFDSYFVGLPEEKARELQNIEKYMKSLLQDAEANHWRSVSLAACRKSINPNSTKPVADSVTTTVNDLLDSISDTSASETRDQALRALIKDAIDLAQLLRVQKATFKFVMPVVEDYQITIFDAESMEDIGGEDEDSLIGREIRCVTFPGIVKEGNESGEQMQLRNVIAKARVLCSPD